MKNTASDLIVKSFFTLPQGAISETPSFFVVIDRSPAVTWSGGGRGSRSQLGKTDFLTEKKSWKVSKDSRIEPDDDDDDDILTVDHLGMRSPQERE